LMVKLLIDTYKTAEHQPLEPILPT